MPPVIEPIVTALVETVFTAAGIESFAAFATTIAVLTDVVLLAPIYVYNRQQALKAQRALSAMQNHTLTIKQAAATRSMLYGRARIGGVMVFAQTAGANNQYLYIVVAHVGHECDGFEEYYLNNDKVTLDAGGNVISAVDANGAAVTRYNGKVVWKTHIGTAGQTADALLQADLGTGVWPNTSTLSNICYSVLKLTFDAASFSSGMPNPSVLLRGKKLYDPRTGLTAWSPNSALAVRDYLTDTTYGFGAAASEIDDTACIAAANTCDEAVALTAGGTENRYTTNGIIDTATQAGAILSDLAAAMAGNVSFIGGQFVIRAGAYVTPVVTLADADLRGPIAITTRDSMRDVINSVKGVYISSINLWQTGDFPPVTNSGYVTQDGGNFWRDIQLPFTTSSATAQRLAKIVLERSRLDITVIFQAKLTALNVRVGDNVMVNLPRYGWTSQVFEVVSSTISLTKDGNAPLLGVDLTLRLTNANAWAWNSGLETAVNPAIRSSLYNPTVVAAPTSVTLTTSNVTQSDGTIQPRLHASWPASLDQFVLSGGSVLVQYKKSTDTAWLTWSIDPGTMTDEYISDVSVGLIYNVQVAFRNGSLGQSAWTSATATVAAPGGVPAIPTGLAAAAVFNSIALTWNKNSESDFDHYNIRRSTTNNYSTSALIWSGYTTSMVDPNLTVGTPYYYWITGVNTSGNESAQNPGALAGVTATPTSATGATGATGSAGANGTRNAILQLYQWAISAPAAPTGTSTYTWSTGTFTLPGTPGSWTLLPGTGSAGQTLWSTSTLISNQNTTTTDTATWSGTTSVYAVGGSGTNGTNGTNGAAGSNNSVIQLYQRGTTAPTLPTGTFTYTFATNSLTGGTLNGWTQTFPAVNGQPAWITQVAVSTANASATFSGGWTAAAKMVQDGSSGTGIVYNSGSSASIGLNAALETTIFTLSITPTSTSIIGVANATVDNIGSSADTGVTVRLYRDTTLLNPKGIFPVFSVAASQILTQALSFNDSGLTAGTAYTYALKAYKTNGATTISVDSADMTLTG